MMTSLCNQTCSQSAKSIATLVAILVDTKKTNDNAPKEAERSIAILHPAIVLI